MKALSLFSGGLDSALATKMILDQGVEVVGVYIATPFNTKHFKKSIPSVVLKLAQSLNIDLKLIILDEEYLKLVKSPRYGFGKNLNPCIDCKIMMLKSAKKLMQKLGCEFIITGEVVGQRGKSQTFSALRIIEKEASLEGRILRPLSAKLLKPTLPEIKGWVKRDNLLDLKGRSRKRQLELAMRWKIRGYLSPAGGCLLTDPSFCRRLVDLINYKDLNLEEVELLKIGRHFRLSPDYKFIVTRNIQESDTLARLRKEKDLYFKLKDEITPVGLGRGGWNQDLKILSAKILVSYSSLKKSKLDVICFFDKEKEKLEVEKEDKRKFERFKIT